MNTQDTAAPTVIAITFEYPERDGEPRIVSYGPFPLDEFVSLGRPGETYKYDEKGNPLSRTVFVHDDARPLEHVM